MIDRFERSCGRYKLPDEAVSFAPNGEGHATSLINEFALPVLLPDLRHLYPRCETILIRGSVDSLRLRQPRARQNTSTKRSATSGHGHSPSAFEAELIPHNEILRYKFDAHLFYTLLFNHKV